MPSVVAWWYGRVSVGHELASSRTAEPIDCCTRPAPQQHWAAAANAGSVTFIAGVYEAGWLGSRVVSVLGSRAEGFKSQLRRCWVTVLGKLFTPIVPMFTKQQNWQQPS